MEKVTILIVEDKAEFRTIYGDRLQFAGYEVIEASDGQEALKILESHQVALIMTDINMPNMDGYEFIAAVRAKENLKNIPILVLSVFDQAENLKKAKSLGATDYLVKGMHTPNAVLEKIKGMLSPTVS